jgi:predicted transposase/invertase (TIGR01784 family)
MNDSDHPYKRLFSHPEMIADLIRGFLDPELVSGCDLSTLERCNGSYVTDDLREREDDIIWRLAYGDRTLILYLLIEFQSKPDYSMPVRIMSYMALLWQDLIRSGVIVPSAIPGIIPIVLYNGEIPWKVPHDIRETILMPKPVSRFIPSVPYLLIDELRLSVHHLMEVRNLAACLFGLEQSSEPLELFELGARLNRWMQTDPILDSMRRDFSLFFENTLKRDDDISISNPFQGGTMLAERVNKWIAQYKAEGREEGRIQGKQEGRLEGKLEGKVEGKLEGMATILKRMKEKGMSVTEIATITGLPEDEIQHLI